MCSKGKCRYCGAKIDRECLYAEIAEGCLFVLVYVANRTVDLNLLIYLAYAVIFSAITLIDMKIQIIPDGLVCALIALYAVKILAN